MTPACGASKESGPGSVVLRGLSGHGVSLVFLKLLVGYDGLPCWCSNFSCPYLRFHEGFSIFGDPIKGALLVTFGIFAVYWNTVFYHATSCLIVLNHIERVYEFFISHRLGDGGLKEGSGFRTVITL